jgi:hypothetical protein
VKRIIMTLIAKTKRQNVPVLIGDILLTSEKGVENLPIPVNMGHLGKFLSTFQLKPHEYSQKLHIITPNLCVGVAGKYGEIREFIREMRQQCNYYTKIDKSTIEKILDDLDYKKLLQDSAFIISLAESEETQIKWSSLFHPSSIFKTGTSEQFEEIVAVGTGAEKFLEFYQKVKAPCLPDTGLEGVLIYNLQILAKLLAADAAAFYNIQHAWGAGFEIAYFGKSGFEKLDNIAYVLFIATKDESGKILSFGPRKVLHLKYEGENLIYSCLDLSNIAEHRDGEEVHYIIKNTKNEVFVIQPIDNITTSEIIVHDYNFRTEIIALAVIIELAPGTFRVSGAFVNKKGNSVVYNSNGLTLISLNCSIVDEMVSVVLDTR